MWSRKYKRCVRCGTTEAKHIARGFCVKCYNKFLYKRHTGKRIARDLASKKLTKEYLIDEYIENKKSLRDIAKECNCTYQYVYKKIIEFNISLRDKKSARSIALEREKIKFAHIDADSQKSSIILKKRHVNESFFSNWSQEMAYVLGVVYTDGCLLPGKKRDPSRKSPISDTLQIGQKDPELLKKILVLLNSNAKIFFRKRKKYKGVVSGELYYFRIQSTKIYDDLINLGLSPAKSRNIEFPKIPPEYVRHFIRGCWDGDGSVYYEKKRPHLLNAHFVSGSEKFIKDLVWYLKKAGLSERTIYKTKVSPPSYYIKYSGYQCKRLYHYLYDNVSLTQYLERKYSLFKSFADRWLFKK